MQAAAAAERRLRRWDMAPAVRAIAAFARQPMQQVLLPDGGAAFLAEPRLRALLCAKAPHASPQACAGCKQTFLHVLKCSGCRQACYCSEQCQAVAWPIHKLKCAARTRPHH